MCGYNAAGQASQSDGIIPCSKARVDHANSHSGKLFGVTLEDKVHVLERQDLRPDKWADSSRSYRVSEPTSSSLAFILEAHMKGSRTA